MKTKNIFFFFLSAIFIFVLLSKNVLAIENEDSNSKSLKKVYVGLSKVLINPNESDGEVPLAGYGNVQYRITDYSDDGQKYRQDLYATVADSTMQMIKFDIKDDKDILLVNWQVHPTITGGYSSYTISSDFISSFRNTIEKEFDCQVAYFTGASGNLNPSSWLSDGSVGIDGVSYNVNRDKSSDEKTKYEDSVLYGETLATYVINNYNDFEKVNEGTIKIKSATLELSATTNTNEKLLINAKYCSKIWDSSFEDIEKIINGTFDWGEDYVFPEGYDDTGKKIRDLIYTNNSVLSSSKFTFTKDSNGELIFKFGTNVTRSNIATLIAILGVTFDDTIHSPYHANAVISRSNRQSTSLHPKVNVVSIGDISFATFPGEMFDTNGLYVKENSLGKMTFILGYTNGSYGYMPSKYAYEYGSYEVDTTSFVKGSAEIVADKLVSLIKEVKSDEVINIKLTKMPKKKSYVVNKDKLDLDGGMLTVTYYDNSKKEISLASDEVIIEGFDNSVIGANEIKVNYGGFLTTFKVDIVDSVDLEEIIENPKTGEYLTIVVVLFIVSIISFFIFFRKSNLFEKVTNR